MSMRRDNRIGLSEADRLVAGARPDPGMEGLAELLAAAKAPTPGADLAGEQAAVAGFRAARQSAVPAAPPRVRNLAVRAIAMKGALAIAVLAFGGTALAARTGSLPDAVQERAHSLFSDVGVPAPGPDSTTQVTRSEVSPSASPAPTSSPGGSATPRPSEPATTGLCRAWDAARQDPPGKPVPAPDRRALANAAGGVPKIDAFCAGLLGKASKPTPPTATGPPTGPGQTPAPPSRTADVPATPTPPVQDPSSGNGKAEDQDDDKNKNDDRNKDKDRTRDDRRAPGQAPGERR
jgi:hypothetical protein